MDEIDQAPDRRACARTPARRPPQLARALGLSRTTVQSRIERLERTGVVTGYTVRLSDAHERGQIHAYVMITVAPKQARCGRRRRSPDAGRCACCSRSAARST